MRVKITISIIMLLFAFTGNIYSQVIEYVGEFPTSGDASDVFVVGNHAYIADGWSGFKIVDISDPSNPELMGSCDIPYFTIAVVVSGSYAYVTNYGYLFIVNVSDPSNPTLVGEYGTFAFTWSICIQGNLIYVADYKFGTLHIIDVSDPSNPTRIGYLHICHECTRNVAVSGNYAYISAENDGLVIVDISDPYNPTEAAVYPCCASGIYINKYYAYVLTLTSLEILDISNPLNPRLLSNDNSFYGWDDIFVSGNYAYIPQSQSLKIVDVSSPSNPTLAGSYASSVGGVYCSCEYVYAAAGSSLVILRNTLSPPCREYLPGDINMNLGIWPPLVIGGDVTYLSHYFMGMANPPCLIDGFWASADVNGDCVIMGSDNVKLVRYMKGLDVISWCPDYEPLWRSTSDAINDGEPVGWPNCE